MIGRFERSILFKPIGENNNSSYNNEGDMKAMCRRLSVAIGLWFTIAGFAGDQPAELENPQLFHIHREPARCSGIPYATLAEAETGRLADRKSVV